MGKYVIAAIAGVVLLLVLTYFAGVWTEKAASNIDTEDVAMKDINQDGTRGGRRRQNEPEPERGPSLQRRGTR